MYEIRPVKIDPKDKHVEKCEPNEADYWSIYEMWSDGLPFWIADVRDEATALRIVQALKTNAQILEALKICQVRVFMAEGNSEAYEQARVAIEAAALGSPDDIPPRNSQPQTQEPKR